MIAVVIYFLLQMSIVLMIGVFLGQYNMINNYCQDQYHSWDKVYQHPETHNHIYIGDLSSAQNLNFLHSCHIRTVITAALGMDQLDYSHLQYKHIVYPLIDHKNQNISQFFDQFYHIVEKNIRQGSILVHCSAGISRSATLVISYLMRKQAWTFKQTIGFVRQSRAKVLPNLGFERQLKQYENQLAEGKTLEFPRKQYCHTSSNRRQLKNKHLQDFSQINLAPIRSTPLVNPHLLKMSPYKKETFQVRALKLRSIELRQKQMQKNKSNSQTQSPTLLNFQVHKVRISSRMPQRNRLRPNLEEIQ